MNSDSPEWSLIVHNVAKKANVGMMLRSAAAFGAHRILVAGSAKNLQTFGSKGAIKHLKIISFQSLQEAVSHAKTVLKCHIVGVEIKSDAKNDLSEETRLLFSIMKALDSLRSRHPSATTSSTSLTTAMEQLH